MYLLIFILLVLFIMNNTNKERFGKKSINNKYQSLKKYFGEPNYKEYSKGLLKSVTWKNNNTLGKFAGMDMVMINHSNFKKYHPIPAPVYIIVGKCIKIPNNLFGPLKYASETINFDQLDMLPENIEKYYNTGELSECMVTGSCASVIISAITLNFVMDMCEKYKNNKNIDELYPIFRNEYDKRIQNYLCGGGIVPNVSWTDTKLFGEKDIYMSKNKLCKSNGKEIDENNNVTSHFYSDDDDE